MEVIVGSDDDVDNSTIMSCCTGVQKAIKVPRLKSP